MEPKQQQFSVGYFIVVLIFILILQATLFRPHTETLPYSDFKKLVSAGKVQDLAVEPQSISGNVILEGVETVLPKEKADQLRQLSGEAKTHPFVTTRVEDSDLVTDLEAEDKKRVQVEGSVR